MKRYSSVFAFLAGAALCLGVAAAQNSSQRLVLSGDGETIVLEPYAQNIVRVSISKSQAAAEAKPGYGIVAGPDATGWTAKQINGEDTYSSGRLIVSATYQHPNPNPPKPGDLPETANYFSGSAPWAHVTVKTADGKTVLDMGGWSQADYNHKDGTAGLAHDFRPSDPPSFIVG